MYQKDPPSNSIDSYRRDVTNNSDLELLEEMVRLDELAQIWVLGVVNVGTHHGHLELKKVLFQELRAIVKLMVADRHDVVPEGIQHSCCRISFEIVVKQSTLGRD